jgi:Domain of unknown function (DUF4440)
MKRQLLMSAIVAMSTSGPVLAQHQDSITTEICGLEVAADHAVVAHDRSFLTRLFADEYEHINYFGRVSDKEAEVAFLTSGEFALKSASIADCSVRVYGEAAVATGLDTWSEARYRGRDLSGSYRFTRVYVRRGGRWQTVASHASKVKPP